MIGGDRGACGWNELFCCGGPWDCRYDGGAGEYLSLDDSGCDSPGEEEA